MAYKVVILCHIYISTGRKTIKPAIYYIKPRTNLVGEGRELRKDFNLPTHLGLSKVVVHFISRFVNPPSWRYGTEEEFKEQNIV